MLFMLLQRSDALMCGSHVHTSWRDTSTQSERDKVACRPILDGRVLEEAAGENRGDRSVVKMREMNLTLKS